MFGSIKNMWREAKGTELRKEVEDVIKRVAILPEEVNFNIAMNVASGFEKFESQFGTLNNISADGKLKIATNLREESRKSFDFDMGRGYGLFLLSAYIESQALPGEDAKFVQTVLSEMLVAALQVNNNARDASDI